MSKIDEAQDAIDHGVAERDQRIDRAQGKTVDQLLEELVQGRLMVDR